MRISTAFQVLIAGTVLVTAACFWLIDARTIVTSESLFYLAVLSLLCAALLHVQRKSRSYPLVILLCIYVYQKYILSGLFILLSVYSVITSDLSAFNAGHYNHYLSYSVLGFIAAAVGLIIGTRRNGADVRDNFDQSERMLRLIKPSRMFVYILMLAGISLFMKFVLGVAYVDLAEDPRNVFRIFLRGTIPRNLFVLMIFFVWKKYSVLEKLTVSAGVGLLLFGSMILESSRAGLYILGVLFLILKLIEEGDFLIKIKHASYFLLAAVSSLVLFPIVTAIRWASYNKDFYSFRDWTLVMEQVRIFASSFDVMMLALDRFTELNASLKIMNDMYMVDPAGFLSFTSMLKRIINNLVPGDMFDVMPPQYVYQHVYEGRFIGFSAQEWGLWEYFYVANGYWLGLVIVGLWMAAIAYLWRKLRSSKSPFKAILLLISAYFYTSFLVNYDPAYVVGSYLVEVIVLFLMLPFLSTIGIYFRGGRQELDIAQSRNFAS